MSHPYYKVTPVYTPGIRPLPTYTPSTDHTTGASAGMFTYPWTQSESTYGATVPAETNVKPLTDMPLDIGDMYNPRQELAMIMYALNNAELTSEEREGLKDRVNHLSKQIKNQNGGWYNNTKYQEMVYTGTMEKGKNVAAVWSNLELAQNLNDLTNKKEDLENIRNGVRDFLGLPKKIPDGATRLPADSPDRVSMVELCEWMHEDPHNIPGQGGLLAQGVHIFTPLTKEQIDKPDFKLDDNNVDGYFEFLRQNNTPFKPTEDTNVVGAFETYYVSDPDKMIAMQARANQFIDQNYPEGTELSHRNMDQARHAQYALSIVDSDQSKRLLGMVNQFNNACPWTLVKTNLRDKVPENLHGPAWTADIEFPDNRAVAQHLYTQAIAPDSRITLQQAESLREQYSCYYDNTQKRKLNTVIINLRAAASGGAAAATPVVGTATP